MKATMVHICTGLHFYYLALEHLDANTVLSSTGEICAESVVAGQSVEWVQNQWLSVACTEVRMLMAPLGLAVT